MKMMRQLTLITAVFVAIASGLARADDEPKMDLRGPGPKVGQVFRQSGKYEIKDAEMIVAVEDKKTNGKISISSIAEQEVKILDVSGVKVSKFQTRYIQAQSKTVSAIDGEVKTYDDIDVLAGEEVLSEKHKDKWTHTLVGKKPSEKQLRAFDKLSVWDDEDEIPEGKQPIGRSWALDGTQLKKRMGGDLRSVSGKGKATFARLEKYSGELCAVIESEGLIKSKGEDDMLMDYDVKIVEHRSLRLGIVLKITTDGTVRMVSKTKQGNVEMTVEIKGKITGNETTELKE